MDFGKMFEFGGIWPQLVSVIGIAAIALGVVAFQRFRSARDGEAIPDLRRWGSFALLSGLTTFLTGWLGYAMGLSRIDGIVARLDLTPDRAAEVRAGAESVAEPLLLFAVLLAAIPIGAGLLTLSQSLKGRR